MLPVPCKHRTGSLVVLALPSDVNDSTWPRACLVDSADSTGFVAGLHMGLERGHVFLADPLELLEEGGRLG